MHWISENINLILEISAVILGLAYVLLIVKNKISGWIFGTIGSLISIALFLRINLFAEAILYAYYVIAGVQGYLNWGKQEDVKIVYQQKPRFHILMIGLGIILSFGLYTLLKNVFPSAERPLIDSFTTIFSFIATYLTTKKYIGNWIYWIIIDALTVYLYFSRDLYLYGSLMIVYTIIAVFGYLEWRKLKIAKL